MIINDLHLSTLQEFVERCIMYQYRGICIKQYNQVDDCVVHENVFQVLFINEVNYQIIMHFRRECLDKVELIYNSTDTYLHNTYPAKYAFLRNNTNYVFYDDNDNKLFEIDIYLKKVKHYDC